MNCKSSSFSLHSEFGLAQSGTVSIVLQGDGLVDGFSLSLVEGSPICGICEGQCTDDHLCVKCLASSDCKQGICDPGWKYCRGCTSDAECADSPAGALCDVAKGTCGPLSVQIEYLNFHTRLIQASGTKAVLVGGRQEAGLATKIFRDRP